jgi:hypothetical protein
MGAQMSEQEKKAEDFDFDKWSKELTESARSGYEKAKESAPKEPGATGRGPTKDSKADGERPRR